MTARDFVFKIVDVVRVIDGDTFDIRLEHVTEVDIGFHIKAETRHVIKIRCRLDGFDTPEKNSDNQVERAAAIKARDFAATFLAAHGGSLWVRTKPDETATPEADGKFGRWLGDIWTSNGGEIHLGSLMAAQGLASVWPKRWHEVYGDL